MADAMQAPDRWVEAYSGMRARPDQEAALTKRIAGMTRTDAKGYQQFHSQMWRPVWAPASEPPTGAGEGEDG